MENFWNAKRYSQFSVARTRPASDLLSAIPESLNPNLIYDLGCGPGNSTILLKDRWPNARVIGIDSSQDMLKQARSQYPQLDFLEGNIAEFSAAEKIDLIFANASLHWVDQHETVIPNLIHSLNHQGILAIQMPNNFHRPSHQITIQILQNNQAWKPFLKELQYTALSTPRFQFAFYYNLLIQSELTQLNLWETEYYQEMPNHQSIYDWTSGTGLRPVLSALDSHDKPLFVKQYIDELTKAYPLQPNGKVLFPFRRIFMVGIKVED